MYASRTLENFITNSSKHFPVLLIVGPRQVGKTTILQHLSKDNRTYVTLDDHSSRELAKNEPALFLQRFKPPVLIDEIQYAPELLSYIKIVVDKEKKPGMFWLTVSQQFQLMKGVSESLAGRVGIINLLGLSLKEIQRKSKSATPFVPTAKQLHKRLETYQHMSLPDVYDVIFHGSFPAMWLRDKGNGGGDIIPSRKNRDLFYSSYVQTYLQRDIRSLINVGDESSFLKFLRAAAARTGQLLNISDMARDAEVTPTTAKRWLGALEASNIIFLLEPYHTNITKRMIKAPKLYFLDTGLASYLTEWSSPETLEAGAMSGAILETFIFTEILKSYWHNGHRAPLYYYRDKDKKEIDLLIFQDNTIYPLEFKKTSSPGKHSVKHFRVLNQLHKKIGEGGVVCMSNTLLPITDDLFSIPVGLL